MDITLTPDMERIVRQKVDSGQFPSPADVLRESLRLLSAQDAFLALKADITAGIEQADRGQVRPFDADDLMRRVRETMQSEK